MRIEVGPSKATATIQKSATHTLRLVIPPNLLTLADEVIEQTFRSASICGGGTPVWVSFCGAGYKLACPNFPR